MSSANLYGKVSSLHYIWSGGREIERKKYEEFFILFGMVYDE